MPPVWLPNYFNVIKVNEDEMPAMRYNLGIFTRKKGYSVWARKTTFLCKKSVNKLDCGLFLIDQETENYILFQNQPVSRNQVWESNLFNAPLHTRVGHI